MKIQTLFGVIALSALTFLNFSCSKDNNNSREPVGTVALNMLDESNGKTYLGTSDVYIDKAYNFYGSSCVMSRLGKKSGLGGISKPVLEGLSQNVAVEPGNAYQIFRRGRLREFPSGNLALDIDADYMNVYVVSQIIQEDEVVGANVKYTIKDVPDYGLPKPDTHVGTLNYDVEEVIITLPSSDFEYQLYERMNTLEHYKKDNKIIIKLDEYYGTDSFEIYIRIKESYTYVYGTVN